MNRRYLLKAIPSTLLLGAMGARSMANVPKGVMLMSRLGPTASELYVANADGSGERKLMSGSLLDYHASWSADGQSIVFSSERAGRGQTDVYMARADGSGVTRLTNHTGTDDAACLSPDGTRIAFVSSREGYRANIWILEIKSGKLRNLTGHPGIQGDLSRPTGFFRPAWSPDGKWLAFSSDRNTEWRGHETDGGWEHTQMLSIYAMRADGSGFRAIATRPEYCLGSPKWSPDGKRIVFYEMSVEDTFYARVSRFPRQATSQIVSVDVAAGERIEHTNGAGLKLHPQFLSTTEIGYCIKGGANEGLAFTSGRPTTKSMLRSPAWSADGRKVIYEKPDFKNLAQNDLLYSWDPNYEYRYTDSFPTLSNDGKLAITEQAQNSSIAIMDPDGSNRQRVFDAGGKGLAFRPSWSPDGQWLVFGYGLWFQDRPVSAARIMRVRRDGSGAEALTDGPQNAGFPSFSPDGKHIVFRLWSDDYQGGLRILNVEDRSVRVLTNAYDNVPDWSPDGKLIVFTRKLADGNFDIFTIHPDGSGLRRLTTSGANDAHAVWTADGRILWNSGYYGFKEEAALYDNSFQPYGQIWIMNADGSNKRVLTDSLWEDGQPLYIPASKLARR